MSTGERRGDTSRARAALQAAQPIPSGRYGRIFIELEEHGDYLIGLDRPDRLVRDRLLRLIEPNQPQPDVWRVSSERVEELRRVVATAELGASRLTARSTIGILLAGGAGSLLTSIGEPGLGLFAWVGIAMVLLALVLIADHYRRWRQALNVTYELGYRE